VRRCGRCGADDHGKPRPADGLDPAPGFSVAHAGDLVVVALTDPRPGAPSEEVGVDVVEFLDHRDGVIEYGPALRRDIARAIRRHRPEVILSGDFAVRMIGGMSNQADHRAVGLAVLDAARDAGNRWIFPELLDEGLEPWGGVRYVAMAGAARPTHGTEVTGEPLQRGIASLAAHAEYTKGLGQGGPEPGPFLTWMATMAGKAMGVEAAVLFDVHVLAFEGPLPWEAPAG
jgi:LmbE family N-acetylglucosaminyl deacetylase